MQETIDENLEARWRAANAALDALAAAGVPDEDDRVRELLGELDHIEFEVGSLQRERGLR